MPINESQDKFECRYCGCKQSKVRNTEVIEREWRGRHLTLIKRRRVCRHCGLSYTTVEHRYEDKVDHEIGSDAAVRPVYDLGRATGAMEFINGILKPHEELTAPPAPPSQNKRRAAARNSSLRNSTDKSSTLPPQKPPRRKK